MEFRQNNLTKSSFNENTNNYILKVNSKDRNIIKEPNPFNFKIKFNQQLRNIQLILKMVTLVQVENG